MSEAYRHVLLAVDVEPEEAVAVGRRAADIARRYGARLTIVHVVEYLPVDYGDGIIPVEGANLDRELIELARQRVDEFAAKLGVPEAERTVEVGVTKAEIARVAAERGADLIVVGCHDRHGLALLFGSVTDGVVHRAPCDVLAVRLKE